jgi:hypothetical protein
VDIGATATVLAAKLRQAGYVPVPVELTGLEKGCGSVKVLHRRTASLTPQDGDSDGDSDGEPGDDSDGDPDGVWTNTTCAV